MDKIKRWVGVIIGLIALIFYYLFKTERAKREELERERDSLESYVDSNREAVRVKNEIRRDNASNSRDVIERVRDKGYLRRDD